MNLRILPASLARLLGLSLTLLWLSACLSSAAPKAPTITEQPKDRTGFVTQAVKFDLGVSGKPPFTFQWFRNGVAIAGATDPTYVTPALTLADEGSKYSVRITNADGSVTSNEATLTVKPGPTLTGQPSSQSVALGASASFTVAGSGEQLVYQWYRDELPISGANAATYTISATTAADDGAVLRAYVINPGGFVVSQAATLTVSAAPAITIQPISQTLVAGDVLALGVSATGGNLQYQWRRNGTDISGATNRVLRIASISSEDNNAVFSVVVRNAQGSVTSVNATVTVVAGEIAALHKAAADVAVSDTGLTTGGFVLVRRSTGSIASWGHAVDGQRGDGTAGEATDTIATVKLPAGRSAKAVAAGGSHAMALLDDGSVVTWGLNDSGQLGLGDVTTRSTPTKVTLDRPAVAIAAGRLFSVAVLDDGRVFTWGANTIGQLGDDARVAQSLPVRVKDLTDVIEVAAGSEHVLALKRDGSVWAWGANGSGQLGDAHDRIFNVAWSHDHEVGKLINDDQQVWVRLHHAVGALFGSQSASHDCAVEVVYVLEPERGEVVIASIHLFDHPLKRFGGLLGVGDDWRDEVRHTLIGGKLDALRVNQYQTNLGGLSAHQNRGNHRVDERRLTGTGCTGNQKVRHLGEICDDVAALNVFSDAAGLISDDGRVQVRLSSEDGRGGGCLYVSLGLEGTR